MFRGSSLLSNMIICALLINFMSVSEKEDVLMSNTVKTWGSYIVLAKSKDFL